MPKFTNRLINETSPYLLQHAHNPVNWFPWSEEALHKARSENKMIFLSVGYSSCHWCHVMERESFEDETVAQFLNEHFVCIKVDREERPDIDAIYMDAVQLISRQGGWPLNVWLTPTLAPLYGGTYFPPEPTHQRPSFLMILRRLLEVWKDEPEKVFKQTQDIVEALQSDLLESFPKQDQGLDLQRIADHLRRSYEPQFGGFGSAPKFPIPMTIRLAFMLATNPEYSYLNKRALGTLDFMRLGGIWDHVGGGFSRYSVDDSWTVPHFEKMLYDNAQLISCYLDAYQVTGKPIYKSIVEDTVTFLEREMKHDSGLYYCALDADSEGVEGKFYVWSKEELVSALSSDQLNLVNQFWEMDEGGNFEGHIIPRFDRSKYKTLDEIPENAFHQLNVIHSKLLEKRSSRIRPGLDHKMLCTWNAMLLASYCRAGKIFGDEWIERATKLGNAMIEIFWREGVLYRISTSNKTHQSAFLDDYGLFLHALVELWQLTLDDKYFDLAEELKNLMIKNFYDEHVDRFYFSGIQHEEIISRKVDLFDNAVPGGLGAALMGLISFYKIHPENRLRDLIQSQISNVSSFVQEYPLSCSYLIQAIIRWQNPAKEIVVLGSAFEDFRKMWAKIFDPFNVAIFASDSRSQHELLMGRTVHASQTKAWICEGFTCEAPTENIQDFQNMLDS